MHISKSAFAIVAKVGCIGRVGREADEQIVAAARLEVAKP
jgi:hypothetical protein